MKLAFFLILICPCWLDLTARAESANPAESAQAVVALQGWLKEPPPAAGAIPSGDFTKVALTKADAAKAQKLLWDAHVTRITTTRTAEMKAKVIEAQGKKMKFDTVDFPGTATPEGRSLFISLHGGGNAAPEVNDSQWKNQIALANGYKPAEGIYVAPRAPTDTWNLWHEPHIDALFDRLIENMIILEHVNPNRVYVMGYSAGGDGVYQLGPRMADRWAGAAMMAGHPNETVPDGLRNVPFALQVGANDMGFKRNEVASAWGIKLDKLRAADPAGYEHFTELHAGKGHWMDLQDRKAIPWMEKFTRNPHPDKIVWRQDDVTHDRLYWLAIPAGQAKSGVTITAQRHGQRIQLEPGGTSEVIVRLNDAMMDLEQAVKIVVGGKPLHDAIPRRTIAVLANTLAERGDPGLIFSCEVKVKCDP